MMTPKEYEKNQAYAVEYIKSCIRLNLFLARLFFKQFFGYMSGVLHYKAYHLTCSSNESLPR